MTNGCCNIVPQLPQTKDVFKQYKHQHNFQNPFFLTVSVDKMNHHMNNGSLLKNSNEISECFDICVKHQPISECSGDYLLIICLWIFLCNQTKVHIQCLSPEPWNLQYMTFYLAIWGQQKQAMNTALTYRYILSQCCTLGSKHLPVNSSSRYWIT